jgi:hypothetical protein
VMDHNPTRGTDEERRMPAEIEDRACVGAR